MGGTGSESVWFTIGILLGMGSLLFAPFWVGSVLRTLWLATRRERPSRLLVILIFAPLITWAVFGAAYEIGQYFREAPKRAAEQIVTEVTDLLDQRELSKPRSRYVSRPPEGSAPNKSCASASSNGTFAATPDDESFQALVQQMSDALAPQDWSPDTSIEDYSRGLTHGQPWRVHSVFGTRGDTTVSITLIPGFEPGFPLPDDVTFAASSLEKVTPGRITISSEACV